MLIFVIKSKGELVLKKVLILEDNASILMYLEKLVKEVECNLSTFTLSNIKDAYQCALENQIDLFIIDIILEPNKPGDTSGFKFAEAIRRIKGYAFVPLIFVTSLEDMQNISYEVTHCYSFVEKPFDPVQVKNVVQQCLKFPDIENRNKKLVYRVDGVLLSVNQNDIIYVQCQNHDLYIYTDRNGVIKVPYLTLKKFMHEISSTEFLQCSRDTVCNMEYFENCDPVNGIIQVKNGDRLNVGPRFKRKVREVIYGKSNNLHP